MSEAAPTQGWTADTFLAADQHEFGEAWRYELVDGQITAQRAPPRTMPRSWLDWPRRLATGSEAIQEVGARKPAVEPSRRASSATLPASPTL